MRVTVESCEEGKHGVKNSRVRRRGGLHVHVNGPCAFVHHGRLLQDSGGGTHHRIGAHARRRHRGILGLDTGLCEESLLILLDRLLNVDGGVLGRRLGDVRPPALRSDACSRQLLCERLRRRRQPPRALPQRLARKCGCRIRHCDNVKDETMVMAAGKSKVRLLGGEVGGETNAKADHVAIPIRHYPAKALFSELGRLR